MVVTFTIFYKRFFINLTLQARDSPVKAALSLLNSQSASDATKYFFRRDLKLEKIEEVLQKRDKALPPQHHLILDLKLQLLARYEKIRHGDLELIG